MRASKERNNVFSFSQIPRTIFTFSADEVSSIISGKLALKYAGRQVEAMREIAQAANKRSLGDFLQITENYDKELRTDPVISKHLNSLYDSLMEQNLVKLIEPYSKVQIDHVAKLINLPLVSFPVLFL